MKDFYKPLYIADASVIIKWLIDENFRKQALQLKIDFLEEKIELAIPTLALYEIMNYTSRRKPLKAMLFLSQLLMLKMTEFPINLENSFNALKITQKFPHASFYDTHYHAIAIENNGTFITADENYYKKTNSLQHIKLLKDYK